MQKLCKTCEDRGQQLRACLNPADIFCLLLSAAILMKVTARSIEDKHPEPASQEMRDELEGASSAVKKMFSAVPLDMRVEVMGYLTSRTGLEIIFTCQEEGDEFQKAADAIVGKEIASVDGVRLKSRALEDAEKPVLH